MRRPDSAADGGRGVTASPRSSWKRGLVRWRARIGRWRDRAGRRALLRAATLVLGFRVALRVLPFSRVMSAAERLARGGGGEGAVVPDPETTGRAAEAAGRILAPARPCLPQALACWVLLRRAGHPAELCIGVRRVPGDAGVGRSASALEAHAWVECGGRVVAGGEAGETSSPRYRPLLARRGGGR